MTDNQYAKIIRRLEAIEARTGPHEHFALILNTNPSDTNVHTIDLSGEVPIGATSIMGFMVARSSGASDNLSVTDTAGSNVYGRARTQVANIYNYTHYWAPIDSDRQLRWTVDDTNIDSAIIYMTAYFKG